MWANTVNDWYKGLQMYSRPANTKGGHSSMDNFVEEYAVVGTNTNLSLDNDINIFDNNIPNRLPTLSADVPSVNNVADRDFEMFKINNDDDYKSLWFNEVKDYIDKLNCDNTEDEDVKSDNESDIISRKQYRQRVGYNLVPPRKITESPRNCRRLTIGNPPPCTNQMVKDIKRLDEFTGNAKNHKQLEVNNVNKICNISKNFEESEKAKSDEQFSEVNKLNETFTFMKSVESKDLKDDLEAAKTENWSLTTDITENDTSINLAMAQNSELENRSKPMSSGIEKLSSPEMSQTGDNSLSVEKIKKSDIVESSKTETDYELVDIPFHCRSVNESDSFVEYVAHQKKLIKQLEINNNEDNRSNQSISKNSDTRLSKSCTGEDAPQADENKNIETNESPMTLTQATNLKSEHILSEAVIDELQNNAYILLTLPKIFLTYPYTKNEPSPKVTEISDFNSTKAAIDCNENKKVKKNKKKPKQQQASLTTNKEGMNKKALKMLLYSDSPAKTDCIKKKLSPSKDKEVGS